MKRFIISFVLFFAMGAVSAESGTLTVTSVESTPVTGITVISYELQIPDQANMAYNISVEVSFDEGDTYTAIESEHLRGDVEDVIPGTGKQITWDGKFIKTDSSPHDWLSTQDANLWQGVSGVNNPCPPGYRLPTEAELNAERSNHPGMSAKASTICCWGKGTV